MTNVYSIGTIESLLIAIFVLLLGQFVRSKVPVLKKYQIPEPIVGGLIIACMLTVLHSQNISFEFNLPFESTLMLLFLQRLGFQQITHNYLKVAKSIYLFSCRFDLHCHSKWCRC